MGPCLVDARCGRPAWTDGDLAFAPYAGRRPPGGRAALGLIQFAVMKLNISAYAAGVDGKLAWVPLGSLYNVAEPPRAFMKS